MVNLGYDCFIWVEWTITTDYAKFYIFVFICIPNLNSCDQIFTSLWSKHAWEHHPLGHSLLLTSKSRFNTLNLPQGQWFIHRTNKNIADLSFSLKLHKMKQSRILKNCKKMLCFKNWKSVLIVKWPHFIPISLSISYRK